MTLRPGCCGLCGDHYVTDTPEEDMEAEYEEKFGPDAPKAEGERIRVCHNCWIKLGLDQPAGNQ